MDHVESYNRNSIKQMIIERINAWDSLERSAISLELVDHFLYVKYVYEHDRWWSYLEKLSLLESIMDKIAGDAINSIDCQLWKTHWTDLFEAENTFKDYAQREINKEELEYEQLYTR